MTNPAQSKRRSPCPPAERARIVADWQRSGLSVAEYARQHGLSASNLWRWSTKLRLHAGSGRTKRGDGNTATRFVPVELPRSDGLGKRSEQQGAHGFIELELTNGCIVRLRGNVSEDALKAAISVAMDAVLC